MKKRLKNRVNTLFIRMFIIAASAYSIPMITNASTDQDAHNKIKIGIIANMPRQDVRHFPKEKVVRLDDTINFDITLDCMNCELKKIDMEKSVLKGLYPTQRYINGRVEDVIKKEDILSAQPYMHYDNRLFKKLSMRKDSAVITYMDGNIKVGNVYQYEIQASIHLDVLIDARTQTTEIVESVVLKDSQNSYIRTENGEILLALSPDGSSTTLNAVRYFNFKITAQNKVFSQVSILDNEKEIFLDNRLFGGTLKLGTLDHEGYLKKNNPTLFFPEKYFNQAVDLKLYYSTISQQIIDVNKTVITNIVNFEKERESSTSNKVKDFINSIWESF